MSSEESKAAFERWFLTNAWRADAPDPLKDAAHSAWDSGTAWERREFLQSDEYKARKLGVKDTVLEILGRESSTLNASERSTLKEVAESLGATWGEINASDPAADYDSSHDGSKHEREVGRVRPGASPAVPAAQVASDPDLGPDQGPDPGAVNWEKLIARMVDEIAEAKHGPELRRLRIELAHLKGEEGSKPCASTLCLYQLDASMALGLCDNACSLQCKDCGAHRCRFHVGIAGGARGGWTCLNARHQAQAPPTGSVTLADLVHWSGKWDKHLGPALPTCTAWKIPGPKKSSLEKHNVDCPECLGLITASEL